MEPIECRTCNKPFTPSQAGRPFCSRPCYYESRRGPRKKDVAYRMQTAKGHPIAPKGGVVSAARIALYDKIGGGPHPCNWCATPVNWRPGNPYAKDALIADHLDWNPANDDPQNLVPSCNPCNGHRRKNGGSRPIQEGELTINWGGSRTRAVKRFCNLCGAEFLTVPAEVNIGKGRYCSRSCARSNPRL